MQNWLNYHHLLYFKVIAETGSLARASEVLRVGQSALSMQLKQLEDRLEHQLFERKQKKLVLTEAGQLTLEYAKEIFSLGTEMLDTLSDSRATIGRSRIQIGIEEGVPHFAATALLHKAMGEGAPAVTHGNADSLVQDLEEHRLDIVLLLEQPHTKAKSILLSKRVMRESLLALAAPTFATLKKNFPQSLVNVPLLLPSPLSRHRHEVERFFHEQAIPMNVRLETDEPMLLENLAVAGHGVLFTPARAVESRKKELVVLGELPGQMELWLVGLKRKMINTVAEQLLKNFKIS